MVAAESKNSGADEPPDDITVVGVSPLSYGPTEPSTPVGDGAQTPKGGESPYGLTDQTNFLPTRQVIMVFLGMSVALACSFLDQTIIATALPRISSDLHAGRDSSWVATAYLLTSLAFTPLYGRWSDIFGRKVVLIASLGIFMLFSLACALSQTMIQLIVFRAFQGIGGGAIITMVLIIISDVVSLKDRGKYQGINEAVIAVSNGLGPVIGGLFAEYTTWRWAFYINLPMSGIAIITSIWLLPLKSVKGEVKSKLLSIDYVGSILTIISSILILLGLTWGGVTYPWVSTPVLVPLLLGAAIFALFLFWEGKYAALPIMPLHIFKYKTVVGTCVTTAMGGMIFFAILYYVPQFLQLVRGDSPVMSSLLLLPFLGPIAFVVCGCGLATAHTGHYRYFIIFGYTVWTIAQGLQSTIDKDTSVGKIIGTLLMGGMASGFTFQTSLVAAQAAVPRHEVAVLTGVRNFVRLFGSTISLAICSSIVNNTLRSAIRPLGLSEEQVAALVDDPTIINDPAQFTLDAAAKAVIIEGYTKGFRSVFYLTVACSLTAFLASVFLIEQHSLNRDDDQALKLEAKERLQRKKMEKKGGKDRDVEAQQTSPVSEKGPEKGDVQVLEDSGNRTVKREGEVPSDN